MTAAIASPNRAYGCREVYHAKQLFFPFFAMKYDPPFKRPADIKTHLVPSDRPDEVGCYMQDEPVHKLVGFQNMHILSLSAEGTYHRVFDGCIP
jgi:hypothetical protein